MSGVGVKCRMLHIHIRTTLVIHVAGMNITPHVGKKRQITTLHGMNATQRHF